VPTRDQRLNCGFFVFTTLWSLAAESALLKDDAATSTSAASAIGATIAQP
jgi:hypothetical protein